MAGVWYSKKKNRVEFNNPDSVPTTLKKFKQSAGVEALYQFIYENNIRREFFSTLNKLYKLKKYKKK